MDKTTGAGSSGGGGDADGDAGASGGSATGDVLASGSDCVVCLSEKRDTTVLPCRHMCMCYDCAQQLRFAGNKCPICRTSECATVLSQLLGLRHAPRRAPASRRFDACRH